MKQEFLVWNNTNPTKQEEHALYDLLKKLNEEGNTIVNVIPINYELESGWLRAAMIIYTKPI